MNYDKTINTINNCIYYIIEKGYSYNIKDIFPKNIKDNDLEYLLNYYFLQIRKHGIAPAFYKLSNSIFKHFKYKGNQLISNEVNIILDDLLDKLNKQNNRTISLPINITYFKEYTISSVIDNKYLNNIIIILIIKLAIINYINLELKI